MTSRGRQTPAQLEGRAKRIKSKTGNQLLAALTPLNRKGVERELVRVSLAIGEVVYKPKHRIQHVYFPETAVLSFIVGLHDGPSVAAGMAGAEGIAGLPALKGNGAASTRCVCQLAGDAQRMRAASLRQLMQTIPQFSDLVLRYVVGFIAQVSQTAACNRRHSVSQRCARWLLMTHNRVHGAETFSLTQLFLSQMLGIRREAVSEAAQSFQKRKFISYSRGLVIIRDRHGLEAAACECYGLVERQLRHLYT